MLLAILYCINICVEVYIEWGQIITMRSLLERRVRLYLWLSDTCRISITRLSHVLTDVSVDFCVCCCSSYRTTLSLYQLPSLSPKLRTSAVTYGFFVRLCLPGITFLRWTLFVEGVGGQVQVNICVIQEVWWAHFQPTLGPAASVGQS